MKNGKIEVFTDGACSGNPGKGGYGFIVKDDIGNVITKDSKGYRLTTNNRMELMAVTSALTYLDMHEWDGEVINIYSDSKYITDSFNKNWIDGWKKRGWTNVKNVELMQILYAYSKRMNLKFIWVKGHSGHPENEECDVMAVNASKDTANHLTDIIYEQNYAK